MTKPLRPIALIAEELASAEQMARAAVDIPRDDPLIASMLDRNRADVERLRVELAEARSSDVQLSIEGRPVTGHRISAPYLARVINDLQAAYRAMAEAVSVEEKPGRTATTLTVASTSAGSFRVQFQTAEEALSLFDRPLSERTLEALFDVMSMSTNPNAGELLREWAATATEDSLRAVIRLAATLASSKGTAQFRWMPPEGGDHVLALPADRARALAVELAGATGREILTVRGHLGMAQDDPPRIRVTTADDEHVANVRDEDLLAVLPELLFGEVVAEIAVDMTTSPTTGAPSIRSELLSLRPADEGPYPDNT